MRIEAIEPYNIHSIHQVLRANNISEAQKTQFLQNHSEKIEQIVKDEITSKDFKMMMENRPLKLFKPVKNAFTMAGDKILFAKTMNINTSEVNKYINDRIYEMMISNDLNADEFEEIKTYVYRHGKPEQVVHILDLELRHAKNVLETLYETLEYNAGGVADYFMRPIHRMSNATLVNLYNVIDNNVKLAEENGTISQYESEKTARWALVQIYKIQNNAKLANAIKLYNELK